MKQEEKQLLLKDLCNRLPYGVKAKVWGWDEEKGEVEVPLRIYSINTDGYVQFEANDYDVNQLNVDDCLLYLRPMSSMTEDEMEDYLSECDKDNLDTLSAPHYHGTDWLNKKMFDYRGLIPMGLALPAPEDMYK